MLRSTSSQQATWGSQHHASWAENNSNQFMLSQQHQQAARHLLGEYAAGAQRMRRSTPACYSSAVASVDALRCQVKGVCTNCTRCDYLLIQTSCTRQNTECAIHVRKTSLRNVQSVPCAQLKSTVETSCCCTGLGFGF
jgi:hypothetical protein